MMLRVKDCGCPSPDAQPSYDELDLGECFDRENIRSGLRHVYFSLLGRHKPLPSLGDVLPHAHIVSSVTPELRCVPLAQIVGSENRSHDFDVCFRPINRDLRERWCRMARLMRSEASLPPVDLIATHVGYFVRDGNHRVSVARALKLCDIDARIVAYEL
jgi:hypothetical protein